MPLCCQVATLYCGLLRTVQYRWKEALQAGAAPTAVLEASHRVGDLPNCYCILTQPGLQAALSVASLEEMGGNRQ